MQKILEQIALHAGLFDRSDGRRIAITGPDRAKFLHNLLTNDVKRLPVGKGCEAFVTSPQGKTLAFVSVLAGDDEILLRCDGAAYDALLAHLKKYGVFDDVAIEDISDATFEYHLAGPAGASILSHALGRLPDDDELAHVKTEVAGRPLRVIRESLTGVSGLTLIGDRENATSFKENTLATGREIGLVHAGPEVFEVLRIEAGTPVFGKDITDKSLPQEINRDSRAISFVKGCYLGQETVARLDALGHVNQLLKGLIFERGSPCPEPGLTLEDGGKRIGVVTSSVFSPLRNACVALAMLRTSHANPGTKLQVYLPDRDAPIEATVSELPLERSSAELHVS
jgi:tRNA-modifying protein YgfZ